jgi:hypothetical protein
MTKAPPALEAAGKNPAGREKNGGKRHMLVDGAGVPLSVVVTGANRHDVSQLETLLDAVIIERPDTNIPNICALTKGTPTNQPWFAYAFIAFCKADVI